MLKGFGSEFGILADSMKKYEGFPVKNVILIESLGVGRGDSAGNTMEEMMGKGLKGKKSVASGHTKVFSITTEVLGIEQTAIDDSLFEIPKGYTRK
jgi:hypothetical protein